MSLTAAAYAEWGYDKLIAPPKDERKGLPPAHVFIVRCAHHDGHGVVALKITLSEKHASRSLQDGVLAPFLVAYAKKTKRLCGLDEVRRVEVDGSPVAPTLLVSSILRERAPPKRADEGMADDFTRILEEAKERGASEAELAAMGRRCLAASEEQAQAKARVLAKAEKGEAQASEVAAVVGTGEVLSLIHI